MKLVQMPQNWGKLVRNGALAFALGIGLLNRPAMADVDFNITMNYDVTGTGQYGQYYNDFRNTFDTIEGMLQTWSGPRAIESLYDGFTIDITFDAVDGTGGVIAFAGPTDVLRWGGARSAKGSPGGAVARAGAMTVDVDDIAWTLQTGTFDDVIMHEAFHALGFGTLWDDFGYRAGGLGYVGPEGLKQYRLGTDNPYAMFVPLEGGGGGGTAGAHWDSQDEYFVDPSKDRYENMVGFNYGVETFVSDVTLGQFRDLGYGVPGLDGGVTDDGWPGGAGPDGPTKPRDPSGDDDGNSRSDDDWGTGDDGGDSPWNPGGGSRGDDGWVDYGNGWGGFSAVPEPGSATVLAAVSILGVLGFRRRRS